MVNEKAKKLGEALIASKVLTREQLDLATARATARGGSSLIVALLESGFLTFGIFEKFMATSLGMKSFIIGERIIPPKIVELVQKSTIQEMHIFPIELKSVNAQRYLILGMVDPLDTDAVNAAKKETGCTITPCLISLPDFKRACVRHFTPGSGSHVELEINRNEENMVLIRPGGYEEEIEFQNNLAEATKQHTTTKAKSRTTDIDLETNFSSSHREEKAKVFAYIGPNHPRTREEILAKLELAGSDAKIFRRDTYSREVLFKELPEVSIKPLAKAYDKLSTELKIEGLINALIEKGVLTKRDIYHSAAISYIFGESQK